MPHRHALMPSRRPALVALILGCLALASPPSGVLRAAESDRLGLVIIVNDELDIPSIDDRELRRLFLGERRTLPDGQRAALASYGPESSFFNERLLGLSDAEVAGVWSRLRFSGRSPVPRTFDDAASLVDFVARTPNAIGYVPAGAPREGTRVMTNLPR